MYPSNKAPAVMAIALFGLLAWASPASGQTYQPSAWVNDPFCIDTNYTVSGADTGSPVFVNNGIQRGSLYASSPIGAPLKLQNPGDTISCTGQVALVGNVNADGNMQFRVGLYYRGDNRTDTNWLGYMFGNPTGAGDEANIGLYVRNNPNTTVFSSGANGHATRPVYSNYSYKGGWSEGNYEFSLAVTMLSKHEQSITWKLTGEAPNTYSFTGNYTNETADTCPLAFDQLGILGGGALFQSASTTNRISFKELKVNFEPAR